MSEDNVPNKEEKENIFGNMIIEPELNSIKEGININQENIQNINHQILEKDYGKKTNFISNKTKRHKNHLKAKGEGTNYINGKNKSSLSLKHVSKSLKIKNSKEIEEHKLSINYKIDQSNSSLINHQNGEITIINNNDDLLKKEKIEEDDENSDMNIENQENNGNIINNNNSPNKINLEIPKIENNIIEQISKPSLTWNTINDSNSAFVPLEYVNDIWDSFLEKEKFNNYSYESIIQKQKDIKEPMRCILIDWLISLQNKFFFKAKTLFLAVNLIDRYLSQRPIIRTRFQLLGVSALFIASKYEEMYMKNISDFVDITARAFDKYEILEMESELIDLVEFNLDLPLSLDFFGLLGSMYKFSKKEYMLGYFLLEAYLLSLKCCKYQQRQIGLAVCYIILGLRKIQSLNPIGESNFLKYYSEYYKINFEIWDDYNLIIECAKHIYNFYEKSDEVKYREVYYLFHDIFI
jgi:hypothetical protein